MGRIRTQPERTKIGNVGKKIRNGYEGQKRDQYRGGGNYGRDWREWVCLGVKIDVEEKRNGAGERG